jgi:O-antigen/teichoic acid export membrane protein
MAIPLPKLDSDGVVLLMVSCATVLVVSCVSTLVVCCCYFANLLPSYLSLIRGYLWLLPISVLVPGFQAVLLSWAVRKQNYTLIARTRIWQGASLMLCQVAFGLAHAGAVGLIAGFIVGQTAGVGSLASVLWREEKRSFGSESISKLRTVAGHYWRFPVFNAPSTLLNTLTGAVPPIVLASVFNASTAGAFSFSQRVFAAPSTLVGKSLSQVYFAEIAKDKHNDPTRILNRFRQSTRALGLFGLGLGIIALASPIWFQPIFGHQWNTAATYSQIFAPVFAASLAFSPTINFNLFDRNSWQLGWDAFQAVLLAITCVWVILRTPQPQTAIMMLALIAFIGYVLVFYLNRKVHVLGVKQASSTIPADSL